MGEKEPEEAFAPATILARTSPPESGEVPSAISVPGKAGAAPESLIVAGPGTTERAGSLAGRRTAIN